MPHLSLIKVKWPLVARVSLLRATDRIYRSTIAKSALGAGFDGRDQSWPLHPQPPEWGSWLNYTDQGDT